MEKKKIKEKNRTFFFVLGNDKKSQFATFSHKAQEIRLVLELQNMQHFILVVFMS